MGLPSAAHLNMERNRRSMLTWVDPCGHGPTDGLCPHGYDPDCSMCTWYGAMWTWVNGGSMSTWTAPCAHGPHVHMDLNTYIRAAAETRCICPPCPQPASPPPARMRPPRLHPHPEAPGLALLYSTAYPDSDSDGEWDSDDEEGVKVPLALATAVLRPGVVDKRHDFAPRDAAVAQPIVVLDFVLVGTSLAIAPSRLTLQFMVCLLDTLHTAVWAEP
mmetsp:Transcript_45113/g.112969  ORF Transcript_45113/g.112969 Transcript_45113/m.112969 type:complete len:217 (+) Transcript_45113:362-1012(+)